MNFRGSVLPQRPKENPQVGKVDKRVTDATQEGCERAESGQRETSVKKSRHTPQMVMAYRSVGVCLEEVKRKTGAKKVERRAADGNGVG